MQGGEPGGVGEWRITACAGSYGQHFKVDLESRQPVNADCKVLGNTGSCTEIEGTEIEGTREVRILYIHL